MQAVVEAVQILHYLHGGVTDCGLLTGTGRVDETKHDDGGSQCLVGDVVGVRMDATGFVATDNDNLRSPFRTCKHST